MLDLNARVAVKQVRVVRLQFGRTPFSTPGPASCLTWYCSGQAGQSGLQASLALLLGRENIIIMEEWHSIRHSSRCHEMWGIMPSYSACQLLCTFAPAVYNLQAL